MKSGEVPQPVSCISASTTGLHIPFNSRFFEGTVKPSRQAAVFLDRDGVLVRDVHYLREPSQIEILPNVERLGFLQNHYYLIVATNQSGIARNLFTEADLLQIHSQLTAALAALGVVIDAFYYCPHLPSADNQAYRLVCECRKPGAGLLRRAATQWSLDLQQSFIIGDSLRDVEAGNAAGLAGNFLIGNEIEIQASCRTVASLSAAINIILREAA